MATLDVPRAVEPATIDWLLDGDPSIRWQVLADLLDTPPGEVETERRHVATDGWGGRLLALQDDDGRWAGALYSPKWTSTTYTLLLLARLGLVARHPQALDGCRVLWDHARFHDGGLNLAKTVREPETCITSMLVFLAHRFGFDDERVAPTVRWLLDEQLDDGGWNCDSVRTGSTHGSFHTTISALEALDEVERSTSGADPDVAAALERGREFFLDHQLYRSHRTGDLIDPAFQRFPFPPHWHFDVLRGLEHFAAADAHPDDRLTSAVDVVHRARRKDGTWPRYRGYAGRTWFTMEGRGAGRWTTLRALRVLRWWNDAGD